MLSWRAFIKTLIEKQKPEKDTQEQICIPETQESTPPPIDMSSDMSSPFSLQTDQIQKYTPNAPKITKYSADYLAMFQRPKNEETVRFTSMSNAESGKHNIACEYQKPPIELLDLPAKEELTLLQTVDIHLPYEQMQKNQDWFWFQQLSEDEQKAYLLEKMFDGFEIGVRVKCIIHGPTITRYDIELLQMGIDINRIFKLAKNIESVLKTIGSISFEEHIPGTNRFGIYVPREKRRMVTFYEIINSPKMQECNSPLAFGLGLNIYGEPVICDLARLQHLLIVGNADAGKTVCINTMIASLLYRATPEEVRIIIVDPKMLELSHYKKMPHLLTPIIKDSINPVGILIGLIDEMEKRYALFKEARVKTLDDYNQAQRSNNQEKPLPHIVFFVDELYDLMVSDQNTVENAILKLAQSAGTAGIHMVLATQHLESKLISDSIIYNIPSRIVMRASLEDINRPIPESKEALSLFGQGDMLYQPAYHPVTRLQGCYLTNEESERLISFVENHNSAPLFDQYLLKKCISYDPCGTYDAFDFSEPELDDLLDEAVNLAMDLGQISASILQRRLSIGYPRAGKLIDDMENLGIISSASGNKPREILMTRDEYELYKDTLLG